jgi:hypothetical protein
LRPNPVNASGARIKSVPRHVVRKRCENVTTETLAGKESPWGLRQPPGPWRGDALRPRLLDEHAASVKKREPSEPRDAHLEGSYEADAVPFQDGWPDSRFMDRRTLLGIRADGKNPAERGPHRHPTRTVFSGLYGRDDMPICRESAISSCVRSYSATSERVQVQVRLRLLRHDASSGVVGGRRPDRPKVVAAHGRLSRR